MPGCIRAAGARGGQGAMAGPESAAAGRWGATGHVYQGPMGTTVAHGVAGAQGVGYGTGDAAAGSRVVSGTAIKGPEGNEYTHETSAGRGVAAGPEGMAAGSHISTGTAVRGPEGNAYARGATAGRGIVGGSNGAVAGSSTRRRTRIYRGIRRRFLLRNTPARTGAGLPGLVQHPRLFHAGMVHRSPLGMVPGGLRYRRVDRRSLGSGELDQCRLLARMGFGSDLRLRLWHRYHVPEWGSLLQRAARGQARPNTTTKSPALPVRAPAPVRARTPTGCPWVCLA